MGAPEQLKALLLEHSRRGVCATGSHVPAPGSCVVSFKDFAVFQRLCGKMHASLCLVLLLTFYGRQSIIDPQCCRLWPTLTNGELMSHNLIDGLMARPE